MKTELTLKSSSFLFAGKIYLVKNRPSTVDAEALDSSTIGIINAQIRAGTVLSSNGELVKVEQKKEEIVEDIAPVVTESIESSEITEQEEVKEETVETEEDVKKKPTPRRGSKKVE